MPHFVVTNAQDTIDSYGKAILALADQKLDHLPVDFTLVSRVIGLCEALWGKQESGNHCIFSAGSLAPTLALAKFSCY